MDKDPSLMIVAAISQLLSSHSIAVGITHELAMNFWGVPDVMHSIEICVPDSAFDQAVQILESKPQAYQFEGFREEGTWYQPWKKGAARFLLLEFGKQTIYMEMLPQERFYLKSPHFFDGVTKATANKELFDLTDHVDDEVLKSLRWPSLGPFLESWILLWQDEAGPEGLTYAMQAEKLVDANDIDESWCRQNMENERCIAEVMNLLKGKERRNASTFRG